MTKLWPTFTYRDANAAIRFLTALGFEESVVYRSEDGGRVDHAELRWPAGGGVMLGSHREEGVLADLPPGTGSVYVVCADADAAFARATEAGATVVREPFDTDYGSRDFSVRDPEGVFWNFGTYAGS